MPSFFACLSFLYFVNKLLFCYIDCFPLNPGLAIPKELGLKLYQNFTPLQRLNPGQSVSQSFIINFAPKARKILFVASNGERGEF